MNAKDDHFRDAQTAALIEIEQLQDEVQLVHEQLVLPGWNGEHHGMPRTLYGYMMNCFSFIDLLSKYWWRGLESEGQTPRMAKFMDQYIAHEYQANAVAIQLWRHTLMHTANPQSLTGERTGMHYRWLLHWGVPHLSVDQHMIFQRPHPHDWILNVGLTYLTQEIFIAAETLFREGQQNYKLRESIAKTHRKLSEQSMPDR